MNLSKESVLEIVQSKQWETQGFNAYPLYLMCAATNSGWSVAQTFGVNYTNFFYFFSNGRAYMYYDKNDWRNICKGYYSTIQKVDELDAIISHHQKSYAKLVADTEYSIDSLMSMSLSDAVHVMQKLCSRLTTAVGSAHAVEGITFGSEKLLREILQKRGIVIEDEFRALCSPSKHSFLQESQDALHDIVSIENADKHLAIDEYITKYRWTENSYLGRKSFTPDKIIQRIDAIKNESSTIHKGVDQTQKANVLKRYQFLESELFVIDTIDRCFHWQDERKKFILQSIDVLEPALEAVAQKLEIDSVDLKFALPEEINEEKLRDPIFQSELRNRRLKSACFATPGGNIIFTGSDYDFLSKNLHVAIDVDTKVLRGNAASSGIIKGIVRVCESLEDIASVQPGEILVASMTRPEYLPAMQKAIAFITDEGGITCHAAIVAREMQKPCVIGTKYATRILKNGDRVEVNGTDGTIAIL